MRTRSSELTPEQLESVSGGHKHEPTVAGVKNLLDHARETIQGLSHEVASSHNRSLKQGVAKAAEICLLAHQDLANKAAVHGKLAREQAEANLSWAKETLNYTADTSSPNASQKSDLREAAKEVGRAKVALDQLLGQR